MTENKFKKAREKSAFIHADINSDIKKINEDDSKIITRNKKIIQIEKNKLGKTERSRTKHGRNLTIPLFVEELKMIEEVVSKLGQEEEVSINKFIRQTLFKQCEQILGKEKVNKILENQLNTVKN